MLFKALTTALLASTALAHFTLDYPTSRGFDEDIEDQFCGGFSSVSSTRQPFPLSSGAVHIDSHHTKASVVAFISTSDNPTSFDNFNTTSNGTSIPLLTNFFEVAEGDYCWNVNMAGLGLGLTNGSLVTLQIQFNGGDGNLYQCSDLILLSDYTTPSNETCTSDAAVANTTASAGGTSSASTTSAAATSAAATTSAGAGVAGIKQVGLGGVGALAAAVLGLAVL